MRYTEVNYPQGSNLLYSSYQKATDIPVKLSTYVFQEKKAIYLDNTELGISLLEACSPLIIVHVMPEKGI